MQLNVYSKVNKISDTIKMIYFTTCLVYVSFYLVSSEKILTISINSFDTEPAVVRSLKNCTLRHKEPVKRESLTRSAKMNFPWRIVFIKVSYDQDNQLSNAIPFITMFSQLNHLKRVSAYINPTIDP